MIAFRDRRGASSGSICIVHINPEGVARGINPFDSRLGASHRT